jgi:uncharacterized UBP type Zn finger protein
MYQRNYEKFASTAKFWTECYAMSKEAASTRETNPAVQRLMEMGFDESLARKALLENKGNYYKQLFIINRIFSNTKL